MSSAYNPRPPARKQTPVGQLSDIPLVVSTETNLDLSLLAARTAPVPGLAPVVETLRVINQSVERLSWNKNNCRKLSSKAMALVSIISDYYANERAGPSNLRTVIEQTVAATRAIDADFRVWASYPFWKSWYSRHDVDVKLSEHEDNLTRITESLARSFTLQMHDKVAALQESLKGNTSLREERKRAEEQLYRLRAAPPGEPEAFPPPELACDCVRLGDQPEYAGTRNDIWKGRWLDKQDVVLIFYKEYRRGTRDENSIRRFERQIRVWRKLDNPHVLRLYGWCKFDGETYLVAPWLQNRDVRRYLDGDRDRSRKCLGLITEIALGLRYLHSQDIIHGSLKPSNILVTDGGRAVLSDFSLSQLATPDAKIDERNLQVNNFRYQAPEIILDEPITRASDVYSWAMTALEIVTGDPPFHTERSPGQLISRVIAMNQTPNSSDYKTPVFDMNPQIWDLFVRCWKRTPEERPTAKELLEVLEALPGAE